MTIKDKLNKARQEMCKLTEELEQAECNMEMAEMEVEELTEKIRKKSVQISNMTPNLHIV